MDKTATLTPETLQIIEHKGTESPGLGKYNNDLGEGTYLCRRCGLALFRSHHKFTSGCGWPSFDDELPNTIKRVPDADGHRTEAVCQRCDAHLGHIFEGEGLTAKNLRHCINSLSIDFVPNTDVNDSEEAIYAAGCFWGVEYYLKQLDGVLATEVGYTGGHLANPSYEQVCHGDTGHVEAIRVLFDPTKINYEELTKNFFEIHDPTQTDGQGPDKGQQYLSAIFYLDEQQKQIAESLSHQLEEKGYQISTKITQAVPFWNAEDYHQAYYFKNGETPYCHRRVKLF